MNRESSEYQVLVKSLDWTSKVKFRGQECSLREAIDQCRSGETIEGVPIQKAINLLLLFEIERGRKYRHIVDRRYGEWRFTLMDCPRD
jgi:hypothetical protein